MSTQQTGGKMDSEPQPVAEADRALTIVYVAKLPNGPVPRWAVKVCSPGGKPTPLLSTSDPQDADRTARRFAARYNWTLLHAASELGANRGPALPLEAGH